MAEINTQKSRSVSLPPEKDEIDLREVMNLIKHNWKLIAVVTFVFFVFGADFCIFFSGIISSISVIILSHQAWENKREGQETRIRNY